MNEKSTLTRVKRYGLALAFFLYPLCAGFAFAIHPNLGSLSIHRDVQAKIAEFHGNGWLHFGHVLMIVAVPLLIAIALHFERLLERRGDWWGFIGALFAVAGAVILAADKGALCLVPSAFDTLPEATFRALTPGIEAMFGYRGWLALLRLLPLLPLCFIMQASALVRAKVLPRSQSVPILLGSLLMANPDIDLIGLIATGLLAVGFIPYALHLLRQGAPATSRVVVAAGGRV